MQTTVAYTDAETAIQQIKYPIGALQLNGVLKCNRKTEIVLNDFPEWIRFSAYITGNAMKYDSSPKFKMK